MDQTRWFIVFTVVVMMIFALALLQKMFPGEESLEIDRSAGVPVVTIQATVREFQGQDDIQGYLKKERTILPPSSAALDSPDPEKMRAQWNNFGVLSRAMIKAHRMAERDRQGKPALGGIEDAP